MEQTNHIAYLLLQNEYLKRIGLDPKNQKQILENWQYYFPEDWNSKYNLDEKINLISKSLKENKNLKMICE